MYPLKHFHPSLGLGFGLAFRRCSLGLQLVCGSEVDLELELELELKVEPKVALGSNNLTRVCRPLTAGSGADELRFEDCEGPHVSEHAARKTSAYTQLKGPQKFVDCESVSPTQGATQFVDCLVWIWGEAK